MILGDGRVRAIAEIGAVVPVGDRKAVTGLIFTAGHPLCDAYIGIPDPLANDSQNSITMAICQVRLSCGCGCGRGQCSCGQRLPGQLDALLAIETG